MNKKIVVSLIILIASAAQLSAEFAYVLFEDKRTIGIYTLSSSDADDKTLVEVKKLQFPESLKSLHGTPGGGYILALADDNSIYAINGVSQEIELQKTIERFSGSDSHTAEKVLSLQFSPTGHSLYLRTEGGLYSFTHGRAELTDEKKHELQPDSQVTFNRRGTRFYSSNNGDLIYSLQTDDSEIKRVKRTGNVENWTIDPRFTTLWGINEEGDLIVIDESRGRIQRELSVDGAVESQNDLIITSSNVWLIGPGGMSLLKVDQRRFTIVEELLSFTATKIIYTGEFIIAFAADSPSYKVQGGQDAILDSGVIDALWTELKQGEGYACF